MVRKKHGDRRDRRDGLFTDRGSDVSSTTTTSRTAADSTSATAAKARSLESHFAKLSPIALENLSLVAAYTPLERPVDAKLAILTPERIDASGPIVADSRGHGEGEVETTGGHTPFRLPKKPRWHRELNAKAVQCNEASVFNSWLEETDKGMDDRFPLIKGVLSQPIEDVRRLPQPRPHDSLLPSIFERNVQVYRQLWRVMERSHLLLVLLDARCPLLHLPPSLVQYLQRYASVKTILVLSKKDIVGEKVANAWKTWLEAKFGWSVVVTEAYKRQEKREGQGGRTSFIPFLSDESRSAVFCALRSAHKTLITPPARIAANSDELALWRPTCAVDIKWDEVHGGQHARLDAEGDSSIDPAAEAVAGAEEKGKEERESSLCIGLIGQPNVGKSSLLNALVGSKVVRASRTPGKTKTFQTHYLGGASADFAGEFNTGKAPGRVLLCDCPGLVFPSAAGQELQVLGAILPISQVQSTASILRFAASHMPLEQILALEMPPDEYAFKPSSAVVAATGGVVTENRTWTATLILEALCKRHGYKTAKAGRWDLNRAGNALIRGLAEGRIRWAFRPPSSIPHKDDRDNVAGKVLPPGTLPDTKADQSDPFQYENGSGIWLPGDVTAPYPTPNSMTGTDEASASLRSSFLDEDDEEEEDVEHSTGQNDDRSAAHPLLVSRRRRQKWSAHTNGDTNTNGPQAGSRGMEDDDDSETAETQAIGQSGPGSLFAALSIEGGEQSDDTEE